MYPRQALFWSDTAIYRVLHNEKYVGDLCQKKTWTPDYLTHTKKYNRDKSQMIYLENHHEPLIDRALWERTQEELARRSVVSEGRTRHSSRYWCSGKLYCGLCGRRFVCRTKHLQNGKYYRAWRCYAAALYGSTKTLEKGAEREHGEIRGHMEEVNSMEKVKSMEEVNPIEKTGCSNGSVNEKALLACVHYCVNQLPIDREQLRNEIVQEITALKSAPGITSGINHIQDKMDALNSKKRKAIDLLLDGVITRKDLEEQTKWYEEQMVRLSKQLADARQTEAIALRQADAIEQDEMPLDEIMTFDERNDGLYEELLERMIIFPGNKIEIWLKGLPFGMEVRFAAHGRQDNYTTKILGMETIEHVS